MKTKRLLIIRGISFCIVASFLLLLMTKHLYSRAQKITQIQISNTLHTLTMVNENLNKDGESIFILDEETGLVAVGVRLARTGMGIRRAVQTPTDAWGNRIVFRKLNQFVALISPGPDGIIDTADDIELIIDGNSWNSGSALHHAN